MKLYKLKYSIGDVPYGSKVKIIKLKFKPDKNRHRIVMIECINGDCKHRRLVRVGDFHKHKNPYKEGCGRCHYKPNFALLRELKTPLSQQYNMIEVDYLNDTYNLD